MPFRSRVSLASVLSSSSAPHGTPAKQNPTETIDVPTVGQTPLDQDDILPPPVQASAYSPEGRRQGKKARISLGLHVRFDRFLRKLGSGTAPSTSSALDDSIGDSVTVYNRSGEKGAIGAGAADEEGEVDEVVVDREWSNELKSSIQSEHGGTPDKSGGSNPQGGFAGTNTDRDSVAIHAHGLWASCTLLVWIRYRIWPAAFSFFATRFLDEKSEAHYRKENWFMRKVRMTELIA